MFRDVWNSLECIWMSGNRLKCMLKRRKATGLNMKPRHAKASVLDASHSYRSLCTIAVGFGERVRNMRVRFTRSTLHAACDGSLADEIEIHAMYGNRVLNKQTVGFSLRGLRFIPGNYL
jgi:hypothetical protein